MREQRRSDYESSPRRLYRDTERGRIMGVCAGLSDYTGISTCAMRWLMVIFAIGLSALLLPPLWYAAFGDPPPELPPPGRLR